MRRASQTTTDDNHPLTIIETSPAVRDLAEAAQRGGRSAAVGAIGSSTSILAGALARRTDRPLLLLVAHFDEADECVDELTASGVEAERLPALEAIAGETHASLDLFAERMRAVRRLHESAGQTTAEARVLACPIQALMQTVPQPQRIGDVLLTLRRGQQHDPGELARWLDRVGYRRVETIEEPADYAVRGGIIDVFPPGASGDAAAAPVRLDFFGDELDTITEIDLDTMGSDRALDEASLVAADPELARPSDHGACVAELLDPTWLAVLSEPMEIQEQARGFFERASDNRGVLGPPRVMQLLQQHPGALLEVSQFTPATDQAGAAHIPVRALPAFSAETSDAIGELAELTKEHRVVVLCQNEGEQQRLGELLDEFAPAAAIESRVAYLHRGFIWEDAPGGSVAFVPHHELLNRFQTRRRSRRVKPRRAMDAFLELRPGDYAVHADHGLAKFTGLTTVSRRPPGAKPSDEPVEEEFLTLEFAKGARLHVPVFQIDKVQRYVGGASAHPTLSALGGKRWKHQKEQVGQAVRDLASEMLRVQAAREATPGVQYPADTPWQKEFEAEFPYEETDDQLAALSEIKKDMQSPQPADRLICGDVGYGKTELAIRAAFKAAEYGKQVAVLVPTTVLAEQHERTFRERFADYPFRIESISRFKGAGEQRKTLKDLTDGRVDIIIGTHRLLSKDVRFSDLGLVIIDEEQRFGVEHKHVLRSLRATVDVLTLSATPIPRTLHMSMLGLRDISSLATPPMDRRAIVTDVLPYNETRIARAIRRELSRGGQVYFVHNRVRSIRRVADEVQKLAPEAHIVVGHGQMSGQELEKVMLAFLRREADILVCTTIIESGIDIPSVNTMFISDADRFGLADLHQLRGRVGRYKHRAYCYLLLPTTRTVSDVAMRRLRAIEEHSMLGAGFKIAMRDLEIRGAGNLLGPEQSGHIAAVGYEMYCRMLDDAVKELKNEQPAAPPPAETNIEIGFVGSLPRAYAPSEQRRLEAYRRIATAASLEELDKVREDLTQAYGDPPRAAERLLELAELRIGARRLGVRSIRVDGQDVVIRCDDAEPVAEALRGARGTVRPLPPRHPNEPHEVYYRPPRNYLEPATLATTLRRRFSPREEPAVARRRF